VPTRFIALVLFSLLALASQPLFASTILSANGYKTNEQGDFTFQDTVTKTPANTGDSAVLPSTPLLTVSSRFGILAVLAKVSTTIGGDAYGESSFADVINSTMDGTVRIPIIIFGGETESYAGQNADLAAEMFFSLTNATNGERAEVVKRTNINYLGGVRSALTELFETPVTPGAVFSSLTGNPGAYYEGNIDIPVLAGANAIEMLMSGYASCFPGDGVLCEVTTDLSKTLYLGPASLFNTNGGLENFTSNITSDSGLDYAKGTLPDRNNPSPVPEPSSFLLAAAGVGLLALRARR
jgi:hypothetical protein